MEEQGVWLDSLATYKADELAILSRVISIKEPWVDDRAPDVDQVIYGGCVICHRHRIVGLGLGFERKSWRGYVSIV